MLFTRGCLCFIIVLQCSNSSLIYFECELASTDSSDPNCFDKCSLDQEAPKHQWLAVLGIQDPVAVESVILIVRVLSVTFWYISI